MIRRINVHVAKPALAAAAQRKAIYLGERGSDHAPISIGCGFTL